MNWLRTLLSNSNEVDDKRVISIIAFVVLVVMVGLNSFKIQIDHTLIYVFAGLAGGTSLLTVLDNFIQK